MLGGDGVAGVTCPNRSHKSLASPRDAAVDASRMSRDAADGASRVIMTSGCSLNPTQN